ncbi:lipopolysaccharide biosynthesis protein [Nonlabens sp.]|uniref:lipopolysaccharide biosynthesis protein n=1 Tax=Nonlabens sp. TaxID=1888209 RepID=UPI003F69A10B
MSLKKTTATNITWSFIESVSLKAVSFVLSIILARLLDPKVFGVLAIVNVFYLLTMLFIDSGLKEAIIQKKDVSDEDYSSVFWLNICKSCLLYLVLFIAAPVIQNAYPEYENLSFYIRLQSLTLIIEAFGLIQIVKATKELNLKKITVSRIPASLISLLVGVTLAYLGFGILSLIIQQLVNALIYTALLVYNVKYKPQLVLNFKAILPLYKFGVRLLGVSLISRFYTQSLNLIYGKVYSPSTLGLYTKSISLLNAPIDIINSPFLKGLYPTLVKLQDDTSQLKKIILQNIKLVTFLIALVSGVFFFQTEQVITILLGDKWLGSVIYLKIAAMGGLFIPMNGQCQSIFKVKNKVNLFFKIELILKIVGLAIVFSLAYLYDLYIVLIALSIIYIITSFINFYFISSMLHFSFWIEWCKMMLFLINVSTFGFFINYLVTYLFENMYYSVIIFTVFYFVLTTLLYYITSKDEVKKILRMK